MANLNETIKAANQELSKGTQISQEYSTSMEKIGATANTAFGLIAAGLRETNPALSSALGSVQKLIPNLTELGNAAKKTGGFLKAMTSGAGILTLVTLVTTLITDFENLASAIGLSETAINKIKDTFNSAFTWISGKIGSYIGYLKGLGTSIVNIFKKLLKGDIKGVIEEFGKGTIKDAISNGEKAGEAWATNLVTAKSRKKAQEAADELAKEIAKRAAEVLESALSTSLEDLAVKSDTIVSKIGLLNSIFESGKISVGQYNEQLKVLNQQLTDTNSAIDKLKGAQSVQDEKNKRFFGLPSLEIIQSTATALTDVNNSLAPVSGQSPIEESIDSWSTGLATVSELGGAVSNLFSSLSDLMGKDSEEQKALSIASIVASTAVAIADTWAGYAKQGAMTGNATVSAISAGVQTAAILASGIAGIASVNNGTLGNNSKTPSISVTPSQQYTTLAPSSVNGITNAVNSVTPVLVVEDVSKVQGNVTRVKTQSSF